MAKARRQPTWAKTTKKKTTCHGGGHMRKRSGRRTTVCTSTWPCLAPLLLAWEAIQSIQSKQSLLCRVLCVAAQGKRRHPGGRWTEGGIFWATHSNQSMIRPSIHPCE